MPTYLAKCKKCTEEFEYVAKITERETVPPCPKCNGETEKAWTAAKGGFILKGSGWYKPGGFGA